jgi:transcriptional regulator with XRE-family HTH domain
MLQVRFGKNLHSERILKNLTQEQLAEISSYSVESISLFERGINAPSFRGIERLAKSLELDPAQLFLAPEDKEIGE